MTENNQHPSHHRGDENSAHEYHLDFERPISNLTEQIKLLQAAPPAEGLEKKIKALQKDVANLRQEIFGHLSPWQRVQLARHPNRPHALDLIKLIFTEFHEVCGDRYFADDPAIVAGLAYLNKTPVAVLGIEKGFKTKERIYHNFGMPRPEGYRKALRLMQLAGRFNLPCISFIDTPGAYPGVDAEERGQASAIATNLEEMFGIKAPLMAVVIGEGGSGGALALGVADKVYMMEYAIYSVISPESCASILWSDPKKAEESANSLRLSAPEALELGVIDTIIPEPPGAAHSDLKTAANLIKKQLTSDLNKLQGQKIDALLAARFAKFRAMGQAAIDFEAQDLLYKAAAEQKE